jgi:hypothetical protein
MHDKLGQAILNLKDLCSKNEKRLWVELNFESKLATVLLIVAKFQPTIAGTSNDLISIKNSITKTTNQTSDIFKQRLSILRTDNRGSINLPSVVLT